MFHRLSIQSKVYLIPAVRWRGKLYQAEPGGTHNDAIGKIPDQEDRFYLARHDPDAKVFVNQNGRVFDRRRAYDYAVDNDLIADWAEGPFLIAEEMWEWGKKHADEDKTAHLALQEPLAPPEAEDTNFSEPNTREMFQFGNPGG